MIYNLSNTSDREQAKTRFNYLLEKEKRIEIIEKRSKRTTSQNSYLHLILSAFGLNFGYTLQEVKQGIFKQVVNRDLFYNGEKEGIVTLSKWRSTADLDTKELTDAINKFLNYSATNGYRLPEPSDLVWIEQIERDVKMNQQYL